MIPEFETELTIFDLLQEPYALNGEQLVLSALQKKGAPIEGQIWLQVKPEYISQTEFLPGAFTQTYRFWKGDYPDIAVG